MGRIRDGRSPRVLRWEQHRADLLGDPEVRGRFPWLVKLLDCHELLSVQVHPDKAAVVRLVPGEGSKTEAWFILDALADARVWAGLKAGVDEKALRAALANKASSPIAFICSCRSPGIPCVFLPAGTVHAVGGGVARRLAEIQETGDVTFRLYGWGRVDARAAAASCARGRGASRRFTGTRRPGDADPGRRRQPGRGSGAGPLRGLHSRLSPGDEADRADRRPHADADRRRRRNGRWPESGRRRHVVLPAAAQMNPTLDAG